MTAATAPFTPRNVRQIEVMMVLVDNPAQRDWLTEDFENRIGPAVEEFVRWAASIKRSPAFVK